MISKVEDSRLTLLRKEITPTAFAKDLGVILDSCLTYNDHIASTVSSCTARLGQINPVKHAFDTTTLTIIINALFFSIRHNSNCGGAVATSLMVSALDSGASGPGLSPGRGHCVVFLGKTLYSHIASLHPGV